MAPERPEEQPAEGATGVERRDSDRPTEAMAAMFLDPEHADDREKTTAAQPIVDTEGDAEGETTATTALAGDHIPPGTLINGYAIEAEIASGGMSIVYAAVHPVIGKRVAIKVLRRELCGDASAVERFVLEARAATAIRHPNIIDVFDLGSLFDGRQYLVMDLLDGESLRTRLARGALSAAEAMPILADLASALAAAHAKGIIHRDLKPDNIFLAQVAGAREVRLLDFGLAKLVATTKLGVKTRTGAVIGTVGYMSPEQGRARDVDHRTDIYALGVTTFEMLAGRLPYNHANPLDLLIAHEQAPIPSVQTAAPGVPIELAQLVEAMLAKRADDRPTVDAIRLVVKRLRASSPSPSAPPAPRTSRPTIRPPNEQQKPPGPDDMLPTREELRPARTRNAPSSAPPGPLLPIVETGSDGTETTANLSAFAHGPTDFAGEAYPDPRHRPTALALPADEHGPTQIGAPLFDAAVSPDDARAHGIETTFPTAAAPPPPVNASPVAQLAHAAYPGLAQPRSSAAHAMHAMPVFPPSIPPGADGPPAYQPAPAPVPVPPPPASGMRWSVAILVLVIVTAAGVALGLLV